MKKQKQTKPWLAGVRDRQAALAKKFSRNISGAFIGATAGHKLSQASGVEAQTAAKLSSLLKGAVAEMVVTAIEEQFLAAIHGYTDWLACRIIRSDDFSPLPIAFPPDDEQEEICRKYAVKPGYLRYVVMLLSREARLPLLGQVTDGVLTPSRNQLRRWAKLFDWS